ncbi:MAG: heparinase II/III-family protein [Lachnospiraceae bacterium]|nr:heparinase II/III-family protein [Lachnospiraceae bacterium]
MTADLRDKYIVQIYDAAAALYEADMPELSEEKFALFETAGNRLEYEHDYFERRRFLTVFGCAALLSITDGKTEKYADKLERIIASVCDEECWALPAHVNRKNDPDWRITVDLFASETAQALAELCAGLKTVLPEELRSRMRAEIMRRVIGPFAAKQPYTWWERSDMNWNAVCNGSIGMAALDLLDDEPELQEKLACRVRENLGFFLDGFADDGACLEGIGYFTYGFYYYMGFMDLLARKSGTALTELLPERCCRIAEFQQKCYLPSGLSLSFSDGSMHEKYRIGLTCRLAGLYDTVEIPDSSCAAGFDTDPCYRFLMASRDLSWSGEYLNCIDDDKAGVRMSAGVPAVEKTAAADEAVPEFMEDGTAISAGGITEDLPVYVLPSAQWAVCRGASGGGFAVKGGHNAEPHNHNDIGSFIYVLGDRPLLTDLGAGEYTAQYFKDETRYGYIVCSSLGHNVPVINGHGQQAGREFACGEFVCETRQENCGVRLSFAGAYGDDALKSLVRELHYDPTAEILRVEDRFESEGCLIVENLVSQGDVRISGDEILIRSAAVEDNSGTEVKHREGQEGAESANEIDYACRIKSENGFPGIRIIEESFMDHAGMPQTVKRIVWKVADETRKGQVACAFTVNPVK